MRSGTLKKLLTGLLILVLLLSTVSGVMAKNDKEKKNKKFRLGIEVLLQDQIDLIKDKRVGLITNPTGVNQNVTSIVDLLFNNPDVSLTALYGPEHGVRGSAQAGAY